METPSLEELAGRLDSLERENRWLKRIGGASIVGFLSLIALGTSTFRSPREITAERFVLNDSSGHPRARLEMRKDGPALALLSPEHRDQVLLQAVESGSSVLEYYRGSELGASLSDYAGVGASLNLFERNRHSKAELYVRRDGEAGMNLNRYQRGVGLNVEADGTSKLSFHDQQGAERAGMSLGVDGRTLGLGLPLDETPVIKPVGLIENPPAERPAAGAPFGPRTLGAP
jgi:hypothetical protein